MTKTSFKLYKVYYLEVLPKWDHKLAFFIDFSEQLFYRGFQKVFSKDEWMFFFPKTGKTAHNHDWKVCSQGKNTAAALNILTIVSIYLETINNRNNYLKQNNQI